MGEARTFNVTLIVPAPGNDTAAVQRAIERVNAELPDYARVGRWLEAEEPFSPRNGELTATGRLRRKTILSRYQGKIESYYQEELAP